jgi:hypothetical protein
MALAHIEAYADYPLRLSMRVALDDPTALVYPHPDIVAITEPILDIIGRSSAVQVLGHGRSIRGKIFRMDAR